MRNISYLKHLFVLMLIGSQVANGFDYTNLFRAFNSGGGNAAAPRTSAPDAEEDPPRLMVFSFDGFRADYLTPTLTPNMWRLSKRGVTGQMLASFCTKTMPNHHSIATGLHQDTHGIVHNHMYDPLFQETFRDEDPSSEKWWDNFISTPIYIANQLYEPGKRFSCCSPWIGCHASYWGRYQARHFRRFNRTNCIYSNLEWALERMTHSEHPANLALLYGPEPDQTAHSWGPWARETLAQVRQVDRFVGHVERRLADTDLEGRVNLVFLSDHGQADVHPSRALILETVLNASWYEAYGSNPVYTVASRDPSHHQQLRQALEQLAIRYPISVYAKGRIPDRFRYQNHRRIRDFVLVAQEGWSLFETTEQWQKAAGDRGQHGYDNQLPSMQPVFMAYGPAFRQAYLHPVQFQNIDLYPLMLTILGIPSGRFYHQGNLSNVVDMLQAAAPT